MSWRSRHGALVSYRLPFVLPVCKVKLTEVDQLLLSAAKCLRCRRN